MAKKKLPKVIKEATNKTIDAIQNLSPKEKFLKDFERFRKTIPPEYNQLNFVPHLTNDDLNVYFEMSNRSDGKTTTFFSFILYMATKNEHVRLSFLTRHFELKRAVKDNIMDTMLLFSHLFDSSSLIFTEVADYTKVWYNGEDIAVIYDLNNASDLKNYSTYLKKFKLIIFDEFLTLPSDYEINESYKLDLIYSTIDKDSNNPLFKHPKIILLTNPVNFDSEILASLEIFDVLEKMQVNTYQIYRNCFIEIIRNDNANEKKSIGIFPTNTLNSGNITGTFNFNRYNLIDNFNTLYEENKNNTISIKINDTTSLLFFKFKNKFYVKLKFTDNNDNYCLNLKDQTKTCKYIDDSYYNSYFSKRYKLGMVLFADNYTKNYIFDNNLDEINLQKCLSLCVKLRKSKNDSDIKIYKEIQKNNLKRRFDFYDWYV